MPFIFISKYIILPKLKVYHQLYSQSPAKCTIALFPIWATCTWVNRAEGLQRPPGLKNYLSFIALHWSWIFHWQFDMTTRKTKFGEHFQDFHFMVRNALSYS